MGLYYFTAFAKKGPYSRLGREGGSTHVVGRAHVRRVQRDREQDHACHIEWLNEARSSG